MRHNWGIILIVSFTALSLSACRTQRTERAIPDGEASLHVEPQSDGLAQANQAKFEECRRRIDSMRQELEQERGDDLIFFRLSDEYAMMQRMDSALYFINIALMIDSTNYLYLSHKLRVLDYFKGAQKEQLKVAKACMRNGTREAVDIYNLAHHYMQLWPDSALSVLREHRNRLPNNAVTDWMYVAAYVLTDSCDKAMHHMALCEEYAPKDTENIRKLLNVAQSCKNDSLVTRYAVRLGHLTLLRTKEAIPLFETLVVKGMYDTLRNLVRHQYEIHLMLKHKGLQDEGVMMGTIAAHTLPEEELTKPETRGLLDTIFRTRVEDLTVMDGVLSYYERIGDVGKIRERITAYVQSAPRYLHTWRVMIGYEVRNLFRAQQLPWEARTQAVRSAYRLFPNFFEAELYYLSYIREELGPKAFHDSVDHHISIREQILRDISRRKEILCHLTPQDSLSFNLREVWQRSISHLYTMKADILSQDDAGANWEQHYERALKICPDNSLAMNNYAYFLATRRPERMRKAYKLSQRSLTYEGENPSYLDTYGYILYKLKRYEEAKQTFNKLLQIEPNAGSVSLQHYSDLLRAMGNDLAADVYELKAQRAREQEAGQKQ